ncbi:hypothetical protein Rrhod_3581 [Rhodococcus rhodnii LMG 5362]|uniref:Uncharacterized protein n=1 Tax=Rhodococcus rhodnii LMG 5362 TaxID=1273125 RepID=R7WIQ7_9NOCA|nr:hypothetical protein Rrhod_3581 [Rhodococcus rhodnii LMG 5362]
MDVPTMLATTMRRRGTPATVSPVSSGFAAPWSIVLLTEDTPNLFHLMGRNPKTWNIEHRESGRDATGSRTGVRAPRTDTIGTSVLTRS